MFSLGYNYFYSFFLRQSWLAVMDISPISTGYEYCSPSSIYVQCTTKLLFNIKKKLSIKRKKTQNKLHIIFKEKKKNMLCKTVKYYCHSLKKKNTVRAYTIGKG